MKKLFNLVLRMMLACSLACFAVPAVALGQDNDHTKQKAEAIENQTEEQTASVSISTDTIEDWQDSYLAQDCVMLLSAEGDDHVTVAESLIRNAFDNVETEITDMASYGISLDEFKKAFSNVYKGDPNYFYLEGSQNYQYTLGVFNDGTSVVTNVSGFSYRFDGDIGTISSMRNALNQKVSAVVDSVDSNVSKAQQAARVHDYLACNCNYDVDYMNGGTGSPEAHNAYGALVDGCAVCQGYAYAYKLILAQLGIPCVYVTSDKMNHLWNMVRLGDYWYHVDVTYDDPAYKDQDGNIFFNDPNDPVSHMFFLISDTTIADYGHSEWESNYTAPYDYPFESEPTEHSHSLSAVAEVPATCTQNGTKAHWECQECGKLFADAQGEHEVTATDLTIAALSHDWNEWKVTREAVVGAAGEETRTCERCGETETREIPAKTMPIYEYYPDVKDEVSRVGADNVWYVRDGWLAYVSDSGMMGGYSSGPSAGCFGPHDSITRAQAAVILYRMEGEPGYGSTKQDYPAETVFADEAPGQYYTAAINWAKMTGVMTGDSSTGCTTVRPNDPVTRQELCVMLQRYAAQRGEGEPGDVNGSAIQGMDEVSDWAADGVDWAVSRGVIGGFDNHDGTYSMRPQGLTERAGAAKMFTVVDRDVLA